VRKSLNRAELVGRALCRQPGRALRFRFALWLGFETRAVPPSAFRLQVADEGELTRRTGPACILKREPGEGRVVAAAGGVSSLSTVTGHQVSLRSTTR